MPTKQETEAAVQAARRQLESAQRAHQIVLDAERETERRRRNPDTFRLTEQHITLLSRAYVEWEDAETGAPAINPKRPYGNSSVAEDVAEILGIDLPDEDDHADAREEVLDKLLDIHRDTATALQIILATKDFTPGVYRKAKQYDSRSWVRVED